MAEGYCGAAVVWGFSVYIGKHFLQHLTSPEQNRGGSMVVKAYHTITTVYPLAASKSIRDSDGTQHFSWHRSLEITRCPSSFSMLHRKEPSERSRGHRMYGSVYFLFHLQAHFCWHCFVSARPPPYNVAAAEPGGLLFFSSSYRICAVYWFHFPVPEPSV